MRTDRPTRLLSNGSGAVIVRALALSLDCPEPLRAGGEQTPGQDDPDGAGSRDQGHAAWRLSCGRGVAWHPTEAGHGSAPAARQNAGGCHRDSARSDEQNLLARWLSLAISLL